MRLRRTIASCAVVAAMSMWIACVGDNETGGGTGGTGNDAGGVGGVGQPCFPNGTCLSDLTCASDVCVALGGDAASGQDASTSMDASSPNDAATNDGATSHDADATAVPACAIDPDGGFPRKLGTSSKNPGSCTTGQIQAFAPACFSATASATACMNWANTNGGCAACMISQQPAASWGAFVNYPLVSGGFLYPNRAGCEQLVTGDTSCAQSTQDIVDCEFASCGACNVSDVPACLDANESTCTALTPCTAATDANDPCLVGGTPDTAKIATYYGTLFCL
jgi:hypothetical protein